MQMQVEKKQSFCLYVIINSVCNLMMIFEILQGYFKQGW